MTATPLSTASLAHGTTRPRSWPVYKLTGPSIALVDLLTFAACVAASVWVWSLVTREVPSAPYVGLWPVALVFVCVCFMLRLYPGVGHHPAEEFRRQAVAITLVFLGLGTATFVFKQGPAYSRMIFLMAWGLCVLVVPLSRAVARAALGRTGWFGYPAVIYGTPVGIKKIIRQLRANRQLGLRPVLAIVESHAAGPSIKKVPALTKEQWSEARSAAGTIPYAFVAMEGLEPRWLEGLLETQIPSFRHAILVPTLPVPSTLWMTSRDLNGMLGLQIEHQLLDTSRRLLKRVCDVIGLCVLAPFALPLGLAIALAVKLDSPGPMIVRLERVGRHGKPFGQLKFRTMVRDSQVMLRKHLEANPALRGEWERTRKLRHDPRRTRVGRWLRRTSLDELPQLLNVLRGEMSLVGPRPITGEELSLYRDSATLYTSVRPGITGLWQISGRNKLSYERRVRLDAYYVRNWSVWLDLYILSKTLWVVCTGRGAY